MKSLFESAASLLGVGIIYYVNGKYFSAKSKSKLHKGIFLTFIFAMSCFFISFYEDFKFLSFFIYFLSLSLFIEKLFKCSITNTLMVNSFIVLVVHTIIRVCDLLFQLLEAYMPAYSALLSCILVFFAMSRAAVVLMPDIKADCEVSIKRTLLFLLVLSIVFIFEIIALSLTNKLFSLVSVFLLYIVLTFFYIFIIKLEVSLNAYQLLEKQYLLTKRYCESIEKNYDNYKKTAHDIKKHLNVITDLSNLDNNIKEKYIDNINCSVNSFFTRFHSSNLILNIIMNDKLKEAQNNSVKVGMCIEDVDFSSISEYDMTSIFCNLWDNALEASEYVDNNRREIKLAIKKNNGLIAIRFENFFDGELKQNNSTIITRKQEHEGCGLEIIKNTIIKNNGFYNYKVDNNWFITEIILPL